MGKRIAALVLLVFMPVAIAGCPTGQNDEPPPWASQLKERLIKIDESHRGELGIYIKDLRSGVAVSLRANEYWYIASGIKVPVAMAVMRQIEQEEFSLDTGIILAETDFVDGAGQTNWQNPSTSLNVYFLMDQMLIESDNTASDMLIRVVGLDTVNALVEELVPEGFGPITTLADVRRHAYSAFHPEAFKLTGKDFFVLRKHTDERRRIEALAEIIGISASEFAETDLHGAFSAYYLTSLNAAQLDAFGDLLEALVKGEALNPQSTAYLIDVMSRVTTGDRRIKAGLPKSVTFAHKTGTQYQRACDLGVAMGEGPDGVRVIINVCSRGFPSLAGVEQAMRQVGEAVTASGILTPTTERRASHE